MPYLIEAHYQRTSFDALFQPALERVRLDASLRDHTHHFVVVFCLPGLLMICAVLLTIRNY